MTDHGTSDVHVHVHVHAYVTAHLTAHVTAHVTTPTHGAHPVLTCARGPTCVCR